MTAPEELRHADARLVKNAMKVLAALTFLGGILLVVSYLYIEQTSDLFVKSPELAIERLIRLIRISTGIGSLVFTPAGIYFIVLGKKTLNAGTYPPPGAKVIRDTVIRRGSKARALGWALVAGGIALVAIVNILFLYIPGALERAALQ